MRVGCWSSRKSDLPEAHRFGVMSTPKRPQPPGPLMEHGLRLWRSIVPLYDLSPAEMEVLWQCAQTADLIQALSEILWAGNATVTGSGGQLKAHPLVASIADQRRVLDGLLRSLNLPMPDEDAGHRRSPAAQAAAQARWREERTRRHGSVG